MRLHRLRFQNILSFVDASFTCDHHITALVGPNDAGKSNILRLLHYLTGPTPRLTFPQEMRCQFSKNGAPVVDLSFVVDRSDEQVLGGVLGGADLPSAPFPLRLSCREGHRLSLSQTNRKDFNQREGEEVLARFAYSNFIQSPLRSLQPNIPIDDLLNGRVTPETRLFSLIALGQDDLSNIVLRTVEGDKARIAAGEKLTEMLQGVWRTGFNCRTSSCSSRWSLS